jgi:hypothetical protein
MVEGIPPQTPKGRRALPPAAALDGDDIRICRDQLATERHRELGGPAREHADESASARAALLATGAGRGLVNLWVASR